MENLPCFDSQHLEPACRVRRWRFIAGIAVFCLVGILTLARLQAQKTTDGPVISTVAGNGTEGFSGDGGPATSAKLDPDGIAVDSAGNLYIVDTNNDRIRKVTALTGAISTVAGNGTRGFSGDGGPAIKAELYNPGGVAVDNA